MKVVKAIGAKGESRTMAQIREHYEIERQLATRLRTATREERGALYASLYDELYRRVLHHPQLTKHLSADEVSREVAFQIGDVRPFVTGESTFLEIGPGDCALSIRVAPFVKEVYAVDVSKEITSRAGHVPNLNVVLSNGTSIPVPPNSVDVAYSHQVMEHLHPDDAMEQLRNLCRALRPGGTYLCLTPNQLSGPHDISKYFDPVATGLHLKEYTVTDLTNLFRVSGFSRVQVDVRLKGVRLSLSPFVVMMFERVLSGLPFAFRRRVAGSWVADKVLGIRLIGVK